MREGTECTNDRVEIDRPEPAPGGGVSGDGGDGGDRGSGGGTGERWLPGTEPFEGAGALDDLVDAAGDPARTRRVLGRYAAVRLARRAAGGQLDAFGLRYERRVAEEYVEAIEPPGDEERRALGRIVARASRTAGPALCEALAEAGEMAAARSADGGAFVLYRTAFELAWRASRPDLAAAAAEAVECLARARGASERAVRWWRRNGERARRLTEVADEREDDGAQSRQR